MQNGADAKAKKGNEVAADTPAEKKNDREIKSKEGGGMCGWCCPSSRASSSASGDADKDKTKKADETPK